jgi:predicted TIM-barrel fold metal-dependent hydrolase
LFDKYSEPILLDDVASRFNNLKIIIAHGGRFFFDQTAMLLRKHKNIFTEISSNFPKIPINGKNNNLLLIELLKKIKILNGNLKKVFFGSDFPFRGINKTLNLLNSIKSDRSQEINFFPKEIDEILNENLINNLGHVFRLT